jgi:hypothetical protein
MALIRGSGGLCPCPICLIPKDKQSDLSISYTLRTAKDTQNVLKRADACNYDYEKQDLLKPLGLRYIKVESLGLYYSNIDFDNF